MALAGNAFPGWKRVACAQLLLTVVHGDDVQAVHQLALVLMDSLDLHVKHGRRVDLHLVLLLQVLGKLDLVFLGETGGGYEHPDRSSWHFGGWRTLLQQGVKAVFCESAINPKKPVLIAIP